MRKIVGYFEGTDSTLLTALVCDGYDTVPISNGFDNHGMHNVGYWVPQDSPAAENTLIYIISHDSREAAAESWAAFREDPQWQRVSEESQVDGRIVSSVESVFMEATTFSPMK